MEQHISPTVAWVSCDDYDAPTWDIMAVPRKLMEQHVSSIVA